MAPISLLCPIINVSKNNRIKRNIRNGIDF